MYDFFGVLLIAIAASVASVTTVTGMVLCHNSRKKRSEFSKEAA